MAENFKNLDDETRPQVPEELKGMVVSELDFIRDALQVFNLYAGQSLVSIMEALKGGDKLKS